MNGLLKPTSGRVLFDGRDIWEDPKFTRQIRFHVGLVFQYPEYQLFEETVYADIAFGPKNMGLSKDEIDARVRRAAGSTVQNTRYFDIIAIISFPYDFIINIRFSNVKRYAIISVQLEKEG